MSEYESAVRRFFFLCCRFCTLVIGELSDLHPAFVVSRRTSSLIKSNQFYIFFLFYLPVGFDIFNDVGRFICDRPTFSVGVVAVNVVDVDGLLLAESSCE
jgi:hypothetical protein